MDVGDWSGGGKSFIGRRGLVRGGGSPILDVGDWSGMGKSNIGRRGLVRGEGSPILDVGGWACAVTQYRSPGLSTRPQLQYWTSPVGPDLYPNSEVQNCSGPILEPTGRGWLFAISQSGERLGSDHTTGYETTPVGEGRKTHKLFTVRPTRPPPPDPTGRPPRLPAHPNRPPARSSGVPGVDFGRTSKQNLTENLQPGCLQATRKNTPM